MNKYDLIIIGGGSAGLGVAMSAYKEFKKVLIVEKNKISSKTSASSLRIIHGGFRYLQKMDLLRVAESLHDQNVLLKTYKDDIVKLSCIMPLNKFGLKSKYPMICASILYNVISLLITGKSNGAFVGKISSHQNNIDIIKEKNVYALFWNDALLRSPLNFAKTLSDELRNHNIEILEDTNVQNIKKENDEFLLDIENKEGAIEQVSSKYLVNTTGPWLEKINDDLDFKENNYKWCKAFNIILNQKVNFLEAVGIFGEDNRAFFIVPRDGFICVGTWYVPFDGDLEKDILPKEDELSAFITSFNKTNLNLKILKDNIKEVEAGILPMKFVGKSGPVLYGLEKINVVENYAKVLSTKYTTFLSQGRKVIKRLLGK